MSRPPIIFQDVRDVKISASSVDALLGEWISISVHLSRPQSIETLFNVYDQQTYSFKPSIYAYYNIITTDRGIAFLAGMASIFVTMAPEFSIIETSNDARKISSMFIFPKLFCIALGANIGRSLKIVDRSIDFPTMTLDFL